MFKTTEHGMIMSHAKRFNEKKGEHLVKHEQKEKKCEREKNFQSMIQKQKKQFCFVGIKTLNNRQIAGIFTQQA